MEQRKKRLGTILAAALSLLIAPVAASSAQQKAGWLPGLGAQLIDGDGEPSLVFNLMAYREVEDGPKQLSTRFTVAGQRFSPKFDGAAPSSDATITAVALRAAGLLAISDRWYAAIGAGYRNRWLTESWVSLQDESLVAQINRGDLYGHLGLSYRWQRESALIWLDLIGIQLRATELHRSDNLDGLDVLPFWKNQLRANFHGVADRRLRLALLGITFIPTD